MHALESRTDAQTLCERIETLLASFDGAPAPGKARAQAERLVGALMQLYGAGLRRMMEIVDETDPAVSTSIFERFASEPAIAGILSLHGLHPVPVEERVHQALESVRPYLKSHAGNVEILDIRGSVVHIAMAGSCDGCPSSALTVKNAIERAIFDAAPEISEVRAEGIEPAADWSMLHVVGDCPAPANA
ncbi:MAG: NifU family protein [Candidatus Eremiobacteraeota bacterium]|nr:NifU family protein [Candidatus Eremiobacteraeota bacterium]